MAALSVKQSKIALRLALLTPIFYWIYLIAMDQLGADPAKSLNHKTGKFGLYYLWANLTVGIIIALRIKLPKWLTFVFSERRYLGVLGFCILVLHILLYFALEGFEAKGFEQLYTKTYLTFGLSAWLILMVLALTSNNLSVRKMGGKNWKKLHRLVYVASICVGFHILLIEKTDLIKYSTMVVLMVLAQIYRFWRNRPPKFLGIF